MKLAINLATRGRPDLLLATIMATRARIREPNTVFMISADADDEATISALMAVDEAWNLKIFIEEREDTVAAKWNRVLRAVPDADVYMPMCDDGPVMTPGFDTRVLDAANLFPDGIGVVFNHLENLSFTGIQAVTRRWAQLTGYIYPEHFPYWFVDHWLSDVAEMTDRIAFADVRLDCATNRPPTMEMREPAFWATFYDALHLRRRKIACGILNHPLCRTPSWEKKIVVDRYPLIEGYSKIINDGVRAMDVPDLPADVRYARIRAKAISLLNEVLPELQEDERQRKAA